MKRAQTPLALLLCVAFLLFGAGRTAAQNASRATLSGQVTLDDGKPAAGYVVVISSTDYVSPAPAGTAVTDAAGRYTVMVAPSPTAGLFAPGAAPPDTHFSVTVRIGDGLYLLPSAQPVVLTPDQAVRGVNFRVTVGPQVTVRVHDALTGLPVPGMIVTNNLYGGSNNPTLAVTDVRGVAVFHLTSLNANLNLTPPGGSAPTVEPAPGYPFYRQISLSQPQDVAWDVRTYPPTLPATSLWHGVVLGSDGRPAGGATVHILRRQNQGADAEVVLGTDGAGRFSARLPPLGADEYFQYGGDKLFAVLVERGAQTALVTPTPDATWDGMTLRLTDTPLSSYTGVVVDAQGRPEAGVPVSCRGGLTVADVGLSRNAAGGGVTDSTGRFVVPGLPAGRYALTFGGGPFGLTTLPPSKAGYPYPDTLLTLAAGQRNDLGRVFVPVADQVVTGRIVTDTGLTPQTVFATLDGAHTSEPVSLDTDGRFRVSHVVAEPLTLTVSGNFLTAQNSYTTRVIQTTSVQAGQQDVRIVLPTASVPPPEFSTPAPAITPAPAATPVAPAPVEPPQVVGLGGVTPVAGLFLRYAPQNSAPDPQQETFFVTLGRPTDTYWKGPLTAMDGMRLTVEHGQGTLTDRAGRVLWSGIIRKPPVYTVVTSPGRPRRVRLLNAAGRTLWAGPVSAPAVTFPYGDIAVMGSDGQIAWEQPQAAGPVAYRSDARGADGSPPPPDGVVTFTVSTVRAVFQDGDGRTFYTGNLLRLTAAGTQRGKPVASGPDLWFPRPVFPYIVAHPVGQVRYTLTDAQGRIVQTDASGSG